MAMLKEGQDVLLKGVIEDAHDQNFVTVRFGRVVVGLPAAVIEATDTQLTPVEESPVTEPGPGIEMPPSL